VYFNFETFKITFSLKDDFFYTFFLYFTIILKQTKIKWFFFF